MLKKMKWRFVGVAMAAFSAVVFILLCAINAWNYHIITGQQDATLEMLADIDQREGLPLPAEHFSPRGPFGKLSPEMQYMTRFFTVFFDGEGNILETDQEFIASVSTAEAETYAKHVLALNRASGYYKGYRYRAEKTEEGTAITFLNAEREVQSLKTVLLLSGIVALCSLFVVFVLVVLFSKQAVAPYIRNLEMQKEFITNAGHELKTPLTAISTSADILAMEQEENEWVSNIQKQALRLSKLIADLVTLSRLDEEKPSLERLDFSLSDAIWEISESFTTVARAKKKTFLQHIEDGITLNGDRNAIQQMVSILLDNAMKYSDENGTIRLNVRKKRRVEIIVYNTCQVDRIDHIERLFDRFYKEDKARTENGSFGIGLSIAKSIAERHHGTIRVQADDQGIFFTVLI